jgi:hypothetical protein
VTAKSDLDLRRERAANNESLFREVNERINDLGQPTTYLVFVCECSDRECSEAVSMTAQEYEHIRADSNSFFVLPGHQAPLLVEEVVETNERYVVVRKLGAGGELADELDPRQD